MREIRFRGMQLGNYEWVYGYLMQMHQPNRLFIGAWHNIGGEATIKDELFLSYKEVDPKTVGEFIGLKDKNRNQLFEGDVCVGNYPWGSTIGVIEFDSGCFRLKYLHDSSFHTHADIDFCQLEKIGSRHESPELLEVEA